MTTEQLMSPETGKLCVNVRASWDFPPVHTIEIALKPTKGPYVYNNSAGITVEEDYYNIHQTEINRQVIDKLVGDYLDNFMSQFFKKDRV